MNINEKQEFDSGKLRSQFPMLKTILSGKQLVYLDNGATSFKPASVIERTKQFETMEYATVRRGAYRLSEKATFLYEESREKIANFIGADNASEVVFTSGTTQSINLIAYSYVKAFIKSGDEILISHMEHHANIIPWQIACEEKGARLKVIPVNDSGELIMGEYEKLLNEKTKIVSVTHVSNALGTINPVKEIITKAHEAGAVAVIDGAQSIPHMEINVKELDCDFYVFSGHKMYGPCGVGILYGKKEILLSMPPYVTGGEMINYVTMEKTGFAKPPIRFEAGTPPITQAIGLGEAIEFIQKVGMQNIFNYEKTLLEYATKELLEIDGLKIIGTAKEKAGIISFILENVHSHDVVTLLDEEGIAVRGGHHCAQPVMERFNVPATTRVSLAFYNNIKELDVLVKAIRKVVKLFS